MSTVDDLDLRILERSSTLGARWGAVVRAADNQVRVGATPWRLFDIDLARGLIPSDLPTGPAIYAAIGNAEWQYAGKTTTSVANRMYAHSRDKTALSYGKRAYWSELVVLPLDHQVESAVISQLERDARLLLNPRMGQRWG